MNKTLSGAQNFAYCTEPVEPMERVTLCISLFLPGFVLFWVLSNPSETMLTLKDH